MPNRIQIQMDVGNNACPAGSWLIWQNSNLENNKSIYALLLAALSSGKKINFITEDNDKTCMGKFIYIFD